MRFVAPMLPRGDSWSKHRLTDRKLKALRRKGKRYDVMDSDVPGFGVRVSEVGQKTFILIARYPGSTNPTRRALGEYPSLSLRRPVSGQETGETSFARETIPRLRRSAKGA